MSVSTQDTRNELIGNGSSTVLTITFHFMANSDVKVYEKVLSTGVETLKTEITHYTLTGAGTGGGTLTMGTATPVGSILVACLDPALTQGLTLRDNHQQPAASINTALDRATVGIQMAEAKAERALHLSPAYPSTFSMELPALLPVASLPVIKADGTGWEMKTPAQLAPFGTVVASRLLGRGSASGTGLPEALTAGAGLSISGTTLVVSAGGISATELASNAVTTAKIADANVTTAKIADANVTTAKIADANVTKAKFENVAASKLLGRGDSGAGAPQEVTLGSGLTMTGTTLSAATFIAPDSVDTLAIQNDAVTFEKLQNIATARLVGRTTAGSGDAQEIAVDSTLTLASLSLGLANGGVTFGKIADGAVTFAKMQDIGSSTLIGRYTALSGDPEQITVGSSLTVSGGTMQVAAGGIGATELASNAVTTAKILNGEVTAAKLASDSVSTVKIVDDAVNFDKLLGATAASRLLGRGSAGGAGNFEEITLGGGLTMTNQVLSSAGGTPDDNSVSTVKIQDGAVTTAKIADDNVTFAKIANISMSRVLGRTTASSGDIEQLTLTAPLAFASGTITTTISNSSLLLGRGGSSGTGAAEEIALASSLSMSTTTLGVATDGIAAGHIQTGAVTAGKIDSGAVTTAKIGDAQVTLAKIVDATAESILMGRGAGLGTGDFEQITLGSGLTMTNKVLSADSGSGIPNDNSVSTAKIQNDAVTTDKIAGDAVTFAKIQNMPADNNRLLGAGPDGGGTNIDVISLRSSLSMSGTIGSADIGVASGGISATELATNSVTTVKITDSNVTTAKILDANVTLAKIANAGATSILLGRGDTTSAAPYQNITIGSGLAMTGTTLSATGGGSPAYTDITSVPTDRLLGRDSASTGVTEAISLDATMAWSGSGSIGVASGGITATQLGSDAVVTAKILDANVTLAKIANISTARILGRTTASSGVIEELTTDSTMTLTAGNFGVATGGIAAAQLATDAVETAKIKDLNVTTGKLANSAVTLAKIANIATARILGRTTASSGVIEELTTDSTMTLAAGNFGVASGGITATQLASNAVETAKVLDANITLAKIANAGATSILLGRGDATAAAPYQNITVGSGLAMTGTTLSATGGGTPANDSVDLAQLAHKTRGDIITYGASGVPEMRAIGAANTVLKSDGTDNSWGTIATANVGDGQITLAKLANIATDRILGREAASSGVVEELTLVAPLVLASGALTTSMNTARLIGRTTASAGVMEEISAGATLTLSAGSLGVAAGGVSTTQLADDGVTFAKMQNITSDRLLGRDTAASGNVEEISLGATLAWSGSGSFGVAAGGISATELASDAVVTAKILNSNVTLAKIANIATDRILGREAAGSGVIEELTLVAPLVLASGAITTSMNTARLIGRTTASAGVMEEITVGTGLSLSAGSLACTVTGGLDAATQTEMEAASSTSVAATPGRTQYHPGVAKGWIHAGLGGAVIETNSGKGSYNVTSLTDTGTGQLTITWATDFGGADDYVAFVTAELPQFFGDDGTTGTGRFVGVKYTGQAAGTLLVTAGATDNSPISNATSFQDPVEWHIVAFGDQA